MIIEPIGVIRNNDIDMFLCKSISSKTSLVYYKTTDGKNFSKIKKSISIVWQRKEIVVDDIEDARFSEVGDYHLLTFKIGKKVYFATSKDYFEFKVISQSSEFKEVPLVISHFSYKGGCVALYRDPQFGIAVSHDLKTWRFSNIMGAEKAVDALHHKENRIIGAMRSDRGILILYDKLYERTADAQYNPKKEHVLEIQGVMLSELQPYRALWASDSPLYVEASKIPFQGQPLAAFLDRTSISVYWKSNEATFFSLILPKIFGEPTDVANVKLDKHVHNPVIRPNPDNYWESVQTFNPAALYLDGKVHLLYRAMGSAGISYLGYAASDDGYTFDERSKEPAYWPRKEFEGTTTPVSSYTDEFMSGGGWGGCEDPRLAVIDDKVYLTYVAYDGWRAPRVALSTITTKNFLKKKWDKWTEPILLSKPHQTNKNSCFLPAKINDKFVIFHRVFPNILIDYVEDLDFGEHAKWLEGHHKIEPRGTHWDSRKLGVGATPIKTDMGWLLIYQAVDDRHDSQYKIGAMILDLHHPEKVLYRTNKPILIPDMEYENRGHKSGVAYPCGAIIKDDTLFVYYGGADSVVCVASLPLKKFLSGMKHHKDIKLSVKKASIS